MNRMIWYVKQLMPLRYEATYTYAGPYGPDCAGHRRIDRYGSGGMVVYQTEAVKKGEEQMQSYACHKTVKAFRIDRIEQLGAFPGVTTYDIQGEHGYATVTGDWFDRHKPQLGGYYVIYEDGYESYSPAKAFEAGYTLITE